MRRFGDNVSPEEPVDEPGMDHFDYTRVLYGGCAFGAGPFRRPERKPRRSLLDLLSIFGFWRKGKENRTG